jgi:hypothetical protein
MEPESLIEVNLSSEEEKPIQRPNFGGYQNAIQEEDEDQFSPSPIKIKNRNLLKQTESISEKSQE